MIHMLCRFDLKPGAALPVFEESYSQVFRYMRASGLAETSGAVGRRVKDTPMDTDSDDARDYYVVMSFRDRAQLDRSYAHIAEGHMDPEHRAAHDRIKQLITNHVFTCWEAGNQGRPSR